MKLLNVLKNTKLPKSKLVLSFVTMLSATTLSNAQNGSNLKTCFSFNGNVTESVTGAKAFSNEVTYVSSKNGGKDSACSFNGTASSYILLPLSDSLKPATITMSCLVKIVDASKTQFVVFSKNSNNIDFEGFALLVTNSQFKFIINRPDLNVFNNCISSSINSNQWYHVVTQFSGDSMKLYVDGVLAGSKATTTPIDYDLSSGFVLGGSNQTFNLPFEGSIDNFRIFNTSLTNSEIMNIYTNNPSCATPPRYEGELYLSFDGNLSDKSMNKHIVTGTNVSYGNDISGNTNSALNMDGTGYLTMPSGFIPNGTTQFSISLWFNTTETSRPNGLAWAGAQTVGNYPSNYTPIMWLDSNGFLNGFLYDGSVVSPKSTKKLNDGIWHHVAFQVRVNPNNGALTQSIWIDGVMDVSKNTTIAGNPSFANVYVGTCNARGINNNMPDQWFHFKGMLDEVRVNYKYLNDDDLKNYDLAIVKQPMSQSLTLTQNIILGTTHTDYNNNVLYTYQWFKNGVAILNETNKLFTKPMTAQDTGDYYCEVTNNTTNPWNVKTNVARVDLTTTNNSIHQINNTHKNKLEVYPNPATDVLSISQKGFISIYTYTGELVMQQNNQGNQMDISGLPRGLYILKVISNEHEYIQKVVLQ